MLRLVVAVQALLIDISSRISRSAAFRSASGTAPATRPVPVDSGRQLGQATAEYALVLLGVAAIALLVAAWAAKSGKIGELFDVVVGKLIYKAR